MNRAEILAQMKDALDRLYDPVHLRDHPLADALQLRGASAANRGEKLRQLLWDAVETLRPAEGLPPGRTEWAVYNVLRLRYLHAMQPSEVQDELGLSPATYYRRQSEGLDIVMTLLSERIPAEHTVETGNGTSMIASGQQAREEAIRVARESECQSVSIDSLLIDIGPTIDKLSRSRGLSILIEAAHSLPPVYANAAMLHLAIVNLLTEAVQRAGADFLTLVVTFKARKLLWCLSPLQEEAVCTSIESIDGLYVCQGLLQSYGGQLRYGRDDLERPAILWTLPVARRRNVLVIEDSNQTIELYRRYLTDRNCVVFGASDRSEINKRLDEMQPDVILLDVFMPGIDGWTILESLRANKEIANVPIVVCSVLSQPSVAFALGASEVLAKPFSQQELLRVLDRFLYQEQQNPKSACSE